MTADEKLHRASGLLMDCDYTLQPALEKLHDQIRSTPRWRVRKRAKLIRRRDSLVRIINNTCEEIERLSVEVLTEYARGW